MADYASTATVIYYRPSSRSSTRIAIITRDLTCSCDDQSGRGINRLFTVPVASGLVGLHAGETQFTVGAEEYKPITDRPRDGTSALLRMAHHNRAPFRVARGAPTRSTVAAIELVKIASIIRVRCEFLVVIFSV
jgi:hypothetical protein